MRYPIPPERGGIVTNPSKNFAGATRIDGPLDGGFQLSDPRRQAQAVLGDLVAIGITRVNLLLTGVDGVVRTMLETILMDLQTPIASWWPGERLVLPPVARTGTMILHDVGAMNHEDQLRLLEWSEQAAGRTQIVSTAPAPLMPLVRAGVFSDRLYYRLNTVFVDATATSARS
jgi:hypothetical protein